MLETSEKNIDVAILWMLHMSRRAAPIKRDATEKLRKERL